MLDLRAMSSMAVDPIAASPWPDRAPWGTDTFARLQALKQDWDPYNGFRLNQNIPPANDP